MSDQTLDAWQNIGAFILGATFVVLIVFVVVATCVAAAHLVWKNRDKS